MPRTEPTTLPRSALGTMRLNSGQVGIRWILPLNGVRSSCSSRFFVISAMPKQPSAPLTRPTPSVSEAMSKVKRGTPLLMSVPICPSSTPTRHIASPFSRLPGVTKLTQKKPASISAQ